MRRVSMVLTRLTTSPDLALAVDLVTVKRQRGLSTTPGSLDDLFTLWILSATQMFEEQTGRQVLTRSLEWKLDSFPPDRYLQLPCPPLQSVQAVEYLDGGGSWVEFDSANYTVDAPIGPHAVPGRIVLNESCVWPTTIVQDGCVRISFTAGYGDTSDEVPHLVRAALLFMVGHFHQHREDVVTGPDASVARIPLGAEAMMRSFKGTALLTQAPWEVSWRD